MAPHTAESKPSWSRSPLAPAIERAGALAEVERDLADRERLREAADVLRAGSAETRGQQACATAARTHARAAALHDAAATLQQLHHDHLIAWWERFEARCALTSGDTPGPAAEGFSVN